MALHANLNRDPKRKPKPYKASDFFPYTEKKKAKFVRPIEDDTKELAADWATRLTNLKNGGESK